MDERVSIGEGKNPIIFVAPHIEDVHTGLIAMKAAEVLRAFYVVNNGWKRGNFYDYNKEICDCNNLEQLVDVPKDEFLIPIIRFVNRAKKLTKSKEVFIFYVHGMGDDICKKTGDPFTQIVIGYGLGEPDSLSCNKSIVRNLVYFLENSTLPTYVGNAKSKYAAWNKRNLNQLYRKNYRDVNVSSMQIEIVYNARYSANLAEEFGLYLANSIYKTLVCDVSHDAKIKLI